MAFRRRNSWIRVALGVVLAIGVPLTADMSTAASVELAGELTPGAGGEPSHFRPATVGRSPDTDR